MAYTLLDAAYAMYYPEAEFGIKDTLSRLKSRVKRTGNRLKTGARRAIWKGQGFGPAMRQDAGLRAVARKNTKRNKVRNMSASQAQDVYTAGGLRHSGKVMGRAMLGR